MYLLQNRHRPKPLPYGMSLLQDRHRPKPLPYGMSLLQNRHRPKPLPYGMSLLQNRHRPKPLPYGMSLLQNRCRPKPLPYGMSLSVECICPCINWVIPQRVQLWNATAAALCYGYNKVMEKSFREGYVCVVEGGGGGGMCCLCFAIMNSDQWDSYLCFFLT